MMDVQNPFCLLTTGENSLGYEATPVAERFAQKYQIDANGCWIWTDAPDSDGYGRLQIGNRAAKAHRVSYELHVGPVPEGALVCHDCDVRLCVNPGHLYAGTWNDNVQDCISRGRYVPGGKPHPGEANGRAVLTADKVRAIRLRLELGDKRSALAREYGVHKTAIDRIAAGKAWASVQ